MSPYRAYRRAGALAAAVVLVAWGVHLGAQERGRDARRQAPTAKPQAGESAHASHAGSMDTCAEACADCQRACDSCSAHCLKMLASGKKEHQETLQTCLDCAEICAAADRIVSRNGPFSETICRACAEACDRCAKACEQFPDDEHMAQCAKECRKCQRACQEMTGHSEHGGQAPHAGRANQTENRNR